MYRQTVLRFASKKGDAAAVPRFFIDSSDIRDGSVVLTGENARHVAYSLRLAPGDRIRVCDQQSVYLCELTAFNGDSATAAIVDAAPIDSEPPYTACLYQALPKGDKLDTVIQKAVECGVFCVTPFESSRCVVRMKPEAEARKTERRARIAEEAAKQCGRGIIPAVTQTVSFHAMLDAAASADLVLFCYEGPDTRPLPAVLADAEPRLPADHPPKIAIVVGSEGGFSPEEAAEARARGFALVGLGKRILRTETASGFVLAALSYAFEL